jgi:hypothetical protein
MSQNRRDESILFAERRDPNRGSGGETAGGFPWPSASGAERRCSEGTPHPAETCATPSHWIPLRGYFKKSNCIRTARIARCGEFCNRMFLPCAQQEFLSRDYIVTLHGLSTPNEFQFELAFFFFVYHVASILLLDASAPSFPYNAIK